MSTVLMREVARLFSLFPRKDGTPYDELTVAGYVDRLALIPEDYLEAVIDRVLDTHVYPTLPTIGEIKAAYWTLCYEQGFAEGQAVEWAIRMIGRIGGYAADGGFMAPTEYPDPICREMMRTFTWSRLAHMPNDEWTRKALAEHYDRAKEAVGMQVMAGHLSPPALALPGGSSRPALKVVGS